jgi:hypothetical protein
MRWLPKPLELQVVEGALVATRLLTLSGWYEITIILPSNKRATATASTMLLFFI